MTKVFTNFLYPTEICDVAKLFFADVGICDTADGCDISVWEEKTERGYRYSAKNKDKAASMSAEIADCNVLQEIRLRKRYAKLSLYNVLSDSLGVKMPWGSLTGIRPTKLACQLRDEGLNWEDTFVNELGVSPYKTELVRDILDTQGELRRVCANEADLYVGIPFCVSRCSYCSFTSGEISRLKKYVDPYLNALCVDIGKTLEFAKSNRINIKNVYVGGGTPTSLNAEQLDRVLDTIDFQPQEFTVEAGRPDTVTEEKLQVLKRHGVGRISINPQSFNQTVLDAIGRRHSVQEIYDKFELAQKYGFIVNMDLIAGLPLETYEMFCYSIEEAIRLNPHNITVHTLALKKGSVLKEKNYSSAACDVSRMVDVARERLYANGYAPYYMYRQKYMMENLENVGYCKPGYACVYNIGIMEELTSILACGANAISKRVIAGENRIERSANAKDVITYIERTDDYLKNKFSLFR